MENLVYRSLEVVSDEKLFSELLSLRGNECALIAETVLYLSEVLRRESYREAGYTSLFVFCTEKLGYSRGSAYRRSKAAELLRTTPELYELLRTGKVHLSSLSAVIRIITNENKCEILTQTIGATRKEAERVAFNFGDKVEKPVRQTIRVQRVAVPAAPLFRGSLSSNDEEPVQTEKKYTYRFQVSKEVNELLEEAQRLVGHTNVATVLEKALREFVNKRKPKVKVSKPVQQVEVVPVTIPAADKVEVVSDPQVNSLPSSPANPKRSRYISAATRRAVRERDRHRCTFVAADGTRCSGTLSLQFDHVISYACGGSNEPGNIRLRCQTHNILHAEECFGREFMAQFRKKSQNVK